MFCTDIIEYRLNLMFLMISFDIDEFCRKSAIVSIIVIINVRFIFIFHYFLYKIAFNGIFIALSRHGVHCGQ